MSTGDVQGGLRDLEALLRVIKYPGHVDYSGLSRGDPSAFLPIVNFSLTSFSSTVAEDLIAAGLELTGKTDLRFTETFYKVLRDVFHYKPVLSQQQFLQSGFSQRKLSIVCDIINFILQKHQQTKKARGKRPASRKDIKGVLPTNMDTVSREVFVELNRDCLCSPLSNSSQIEAAQSSDETLPSPSKNKVMEFPDRKQENTTHILAVEERLLVLEKQIDWALSRISSLEGRLKELERDRTTSQKSEDENLSVSRGTWEDLQSRLLLLETGLSLSPGLTADVLRGQLPSSSTREVPEEDTLDRLQRINNMLKSTSSLLRNNQATTEPCK